MDDNNSLESYNNQEMDINNNNYANTSSNNTDNNDNGNNNNEDEIIAQAEAPMIQEGFEESGAGNTNTQSSSNRRRGNAVQNQMILGIGDNAYEIMDETGERVYIEFLEFLNCL